MAQDYMLIVDSCCDLPFEDLNRPNIELVQFPYVTEKGQFSDDLYRSVTPKEFYDAMRAGGISTTSQLSMARVIELFTKAAQAGKPAVFLCFTSGLSGSYNSCCLAKEQVLSEYPDAEIYVVDTKLASVAEGMLVFEAVKQYDKGLSASELADWAEEAINYVNHMFMIEDLEILRRGGRISGTVAFAGAALDVKPMLYIDIDGKLGLTGVARGRRKGMKQLIDLYSKTSVGQGTGQTVIVGHADCPKDAAKLSDMVRKVDSSADVKICNIGPVIGSHVGPDMLALVFWGEDRRDNLSLADRIAKKVKGN